MRSERSSSVVVWMQICAVALGASGTVASPALARAERLDALEVLSGGYPRACFFRQSE
jgi:hypothetical protein